MLSNISNLRVLRFVRAAHPLPLKFQGDKAADFVTKALDHEALKDFTGDELLRRASDISSHRINYLKRKGLYNPSEFENCADAADGEKEASVQSEGSDPPSVDDGP